MIQISVFGIAENSKKSHKKDSAVGKGDVYTAMHYHFIVARKLVEILGPGIVVYMQSCALIFQII